MTLAQAFSRLFKSSTTVAAPPPSRPAPSRGRGAPANVNGGTPASRPREAPKPAVVALSRQNATSFGLQADMNIVADLVPVIGPPFQGDTLSEKIAHAGALVTGTGGALPLDDDQRNLMAYFEQGLLLVCEGKLGRDNALRGLIADLKRRKFKFRELIQVDIQTLHGVYESRSEETVSNTPGRVELSAEQLRFIGFVEKGAAVRCSDVHVSANHGKTLVEFRIEDLIQAVDGMGFSSGKEMLHAAFHLADSGSSDGTYVELGYQPIRISEKIREHLERFNVEAIRGQYAPLGNNGRYGVFRLLYKASELNADIDTLGFLPQQLVDIQDARAIPNGIIVVSGPTGSGKSTTLATNMRVIIRTEKGVKIITVEDPIEYTILGAMQIPVVSGTDKEARNAAYNEAIRAALRMDPDTLLVGEVRDLQAYMLAYEAATTGHQTWTTTHANSAAKTITRFRGMGAEAYTLYDPEVFVLLTGQRLVRKLCPRCKVPLDDAKRVGRVSEDILRRLDRLDHAGGQVFVAHPEGCTHCGPSDNGTGGYKGRGVCAETLRPDYTWMNFMKAEEYLKAEAHWKEKGGIDMRHAGRIKMMAGELCPVEYERVLGHIDAH